MDNEIAKTAEMDAEALTVWIEERGFTWDVGRTSNLAEARIWVWPYVVGRYRPHGRESIREMLLAALATVPPEVMNASQGEILKMAMRYGK